jgi:hypothetical protein
LNRASVCCGTVTLFALTLNACGGGGGDDGPPAPPPEQLSLSTNQLNFAAAKNSPISQGQEISGTISGTPAAVFVTIAHTNVGISSVSLPAILNGRATSTVATRPASTLQEGVYQDTITVTACPNQACTTQFSGSPQTVNVTYIVGIAATPTTFAAQAVEGATPAAQNLDLRFFGGSAGWSTSTTYSSGNAWLTVQQASTTALPSTANLSFASLPAGDYAASLRVSVAPGSGNASTRDIPVTYSVLPLLNIIAPAPFTVTNQQAAAGQNRTIAVGTRDAARQSSWTAQLQSPAPWLTITSASGNTANSDSLRVELVPVEVAKLRNGTHTANVVVTPAAANASPVIVPVRIDLDRTHVSTVAPYVAGSNRTAIVSIRGNRFDAAAITNVMFGTTPSAAPIQVVSDQKIVATHPALAAGRYPVTLVMNNGTTPGTSAELVVQDSLSYATAANVVRGPPFTAFAPIFDPERASCIFVQHTGVTVVRREPAGWVQHAFPFPQPFAFITGGGLSTDGRELFLAADSNLIVHLDPATMQETRRFDAGTRQLNSSIFVGHSNALEGNEVGFEFDQRLRRYDPTRNASFEIAPQPNGQMQRFFYSRIGNKIVYNTQTFGFGSELFIVDPLGGGAVPFFSTSATLNSMLSTTLADRWALVGESSHGHHDVILTNGQGSEIARFEAFSSWYSVLSADGRRFIYTGTSRNGSSASDPGVRVLDLTGIAPGVVPPETHELNLPVNNLYGPLFLTPDESELVFCNQERVTALALPPPPP